MVNNNQIQTTFYFYICILLHHINYAKELSIFVTELQRYLQSNNESLKQLLIPKIDLYNTFKYCDFSGRCLRHDYTEIFPIQ